MSETRVLGGVEASLAIARVTLTRLLRGRAIWVIAGMSALPTLQAAVQSSASTEDVSVGGIFIIWALLLAILPPVTIAPAIGEEIEERTMTYLWSRPIPRGSIVIGKIFALVPVLWLALGAAVMVPFYLFVPSADATPESAARIVAMTILATLGASAVTAGMTTFVPRYGTILSIAYLLFIDPPLALTDSAISRLSVVYNSMSLAGVEHASAVLPSVLWMAGLIVLWVGIAVWKIRRLE